MGGKKGRKTKDLQKKIMEIYLYRQNYIKNIETTAKKRSSNNKKHKKWKSKWIKYKMRWKKI